MKKLPALFFSLILAFSVAAFVSCENVDIGGTDVPTVVLDPDDGGETPGSETPGGETQGESEHEYGNMYYARPATFFSDGNIAYYYCEKCGKYFDENKNEAETVVIPKLSTDIVLLVNGTKVADFTLSEQNENLIVWELSYTELKKGDLIEVADKTDNTQKYSYFADTSSNITKEYKIHNDVDLADIDIMCTPNGLQLSVSGFEYDRMTVNLTRNEAVSIYPMNEISYDFGSPTESYIYGYLYVEEGDKIVIEDHDNDVFYDYSDIYQPDLWQSFLFLQGADDEIVISRAARLGFELNKATKEIRIDAVYEPTNADKYELELKGETEKAPMTKTSYDKDSAEYEQFTYIINHETTVNAEDIRQAVVNGYTFYSFSTAFPANSEIRIYNGTGYVSSYHLVDIVGFDDALNAVEVGADYVKIKEAGTYNIMYTECVDSFVIYKTEKTTATYKYMTGGNMYDIEPDAAGIIALTSFTAEKFETLTFIKGTDIIGVTLAPGIDPSTAACNNGVIMIYKAGTYDIAFNTGTNIVNIVDKTPASLVGGMIMNLSSYSSKTFSQSPGDTNEVFASGITVTDTTARFSITDSKGDGVTGITIDAGSGELAALYVPGSYFITFKEAGTYAIFITKDTHVIRVVKTN